MTTKYKSKITPAAHQRMQKKTSQEQLMDVLKELRTEDKESDTVPDADDSSVTKPNQYL